MFTSAKYQWKRTRLFARQAKTRDYFNRKIEEARRKSKSKEDIETLRAEAHFEYSYTKALIDELITNHLISIARRVIIELPDYGDETMWKESQYVGHSKLLSEKGISRLRSDVRKERGERKNIWIPWVAAITGLIGALTGLVSILLK